VVVHAVGGVDDHVHLAVSIPPTVTVSDAVRRIKGASSRALKVDVAPYFGWQREYSIDSFSERHLPKVAAYITNQHQHHRDRTTIASIEPITDDADERIATRAKTQHL
jgi:putative transposase